MAMYRSILHPRSITRGLRSSITISNPKTSRNGPIVINRTRRIKLSMPQVSASSSDRTSEYRPNRGTLIYCSVWLLMAGLSGIALKPTGTRKTLNGRSFLAPNNSAISPISGNYRTGSPNPSSGSSNWNCPFFDATRADLSTFPVERVSTSPLSLSQIVPSSVLVSPVRVGTHHGFGRLVACPPYPPSGKRADGGKRSCNPDRDARFRLGGLQRAPRSCDRAHNLSTPKHSVKFTDYSDSRLSLHIMGFAT